jgi:preprotein translocase subunit SecE
VNNISIIVTVAIIAVVFIALWATGKLASLKDFVDGTVEELKKCSWPTWAELKGSTLVVFISIAILGLFTVAVDLVFSLLVRAI